MKRLTFMLFGAMVAVALALASCTEENVPDIDEPAVEEPAVDPRGEGYVVGDVEALDEQSRSVLSHNQIDFAHRSFGKLIADSPNQNHVYSPVSLYMCLAALGNGASGATLQEIETAMGVTGIKDAVALCRYQLDEFAKAEAAYKKFRREYEHFLIHSVGDLTEEEINEMLETIDSERRQTIRVANSIWCKPDYTPYASYLDESQKWLDTQVMQADLSTPEGIAQVNNWASEQTSGMIDRLFLTPQSVATLMTVVNTLYLNLTWGERYEQSDKTYEFHNFDGSVSQVAKLGNQMESMKLAENGDMIVLSKSLGADDDVAVYELVIPKSESITPASLMGDSRVEDLVAVQENCLVQLTMPAYECAVDYPYLANMLDQMGVSTMFSGDADFSRVGPDKFTLHNIIQRTNFKVTHRGIEASAATATVHYGDNMKPKEPRVIVVDRPFGFRLRHLSSNAILFMGVINQL